MNKVLSAIQAIVPIFPGTAEADTALPYATYTESSTPIVTFDGIASYEGTLSVAVFANKKLVAQRLRDSIVSALHNVTFDDLTLYYQSSDYVDYADMAIASYELTFNVLK